ncbi:hypothetical protein RHECNPAF_1740028 [Rhizobium etli CNPAF512]|nr:hypothetical protein RHECNPAF_1740028 [Rhizobium etli CNPAF512]
MIEPLTQQQKGGRGKAEGLPLEIFKGTGSDCALFRAAGDSG